MQGNDLVQRLRDRAYGSKIPDPLVEEAADEIERLRAALVAVALQDATLSVSEGRLFVDAGDTEELAFDYATPERLG